VGAQGLTPRPWMGSARTERRLLARPVWPPWAVRRGPRPVGYPLARVRVDQWMRCRWRRRSDSAGIYREYSGSPRGMWPGPSGSAPPGTIGPWTRRRRRAGRDPDHTGSVALPRTGCRGQWPTPHTYAKWPRCSEMLRRRRSPQARMESRQRNPVRPSPRRSRRPRVRRRCRRARAKRLLRTPARTHSGSRPGVQVAPEWRPRWRWPPPVANGLRGRARVRRPLRGRRETGLVGSSAVGAACHVTSRPHHRGPPHQRRAGTARRARLPTPVGRTRLRAAAAPPRLATAVATTGRHAVDDGLARPRSARSGPWCRRRCVPSEGSSGRKPSWTLVSRGSSHRQGTVSRCGGDACTSPAVTPSAVSAQTSRH